MIKESITIKQLITTMKISKQHKPLIGVRSLFHWPDFPVHCTRLKIHLFNISYPSPLWLYSACTVTLSCFEHHNRSSLLTYCNSKWLTPMYLCHRAVQFGTGQRVVMLNYSQGSENMLSLTPGQQHGTLCHTNSELHQPWTVSNPDWSHTFLRSLLICRLNVVLVLLTM